VGGQHPIVWDIEWSDATNNQNKIHSGLNQPPIGTPTHNNQPKIRGKDGGVIEEALQPGGSMQGG
jgi:hypothetical protein